MRHHGTIERRHSWNAGLRERVRRLEGRWNRVHPAIAVQPAVGNSTITRDEWGRFGISEADRHLLEEQRPNVLIIGSAASVDRLVPLLMRSCIPPVVWCSGSPLALPSSEVGTLALANAQQLNSMDQALLFAWLSCAVPRRQVITTAAVPLFPAVVRRTFNEALFYRLNAMCLVLRDDLASDAVPRS